MSNYGRRAFCFAGVYVWSSFTLWTHSTIDIIGYLQALIKNLRTPADCWSALDTIFLNCFMHYISVLTYYLLLLLLICRRYSRKADFEQIHITLSYICMPERLTVTTRMWADAQRDDRPAEYRWRPLRKFGNSIPCATPQSLANPAAGVPCSNASNIG